MLLLRLAGYWLAMTPFSLFSLGATATLDNSMAFYLDYLLDVGAEDYYAQSIEGGFKARF